MFLIFTPAIKLKTKIEIMLDYTVSPKVEKELISLRSELRKVSNDRFLAKMNNVCYVSLTKKITDLNSEIIRCKEILIKANYYFLPY